MEVVCMRRYSILLFILMMLMAFVLSGCGLQSEKINNHGKEGNDGKVSANSDYPKRPIQLLCRGDLEEALIR